MSQRTERIADLLRVELATLVRREMRDPRVRLVTIVEVQVSPDLRHARVHVSALGGESDRAAAVTALDRAQGFLRRELAQRLDLRTTPELTFELDRTAERGQRISDLLAEVAPEESDEAS
jgi:ribosome-binding factor A